MKVNLLKASFIGNKKNLRTIINALKGTASFQMTTYKGITRQDIDNENYEKLVGIKKQFESALEFINNPNGEEEQFHQRIAQFLRDGCQDPLTQILDRKLMSDLSDADRQRYVLNMSFRVNKSIERYATSQAQQRCL